MINMLTFTRGRNCAGETSEIEKKLRMLTSVPVEDECDMHYPKSITERRAIGMVVMSGIPVLKKVSTCA